MLLEPWKSSKITAFMELTKLALIPHNNFYKSFFSCQPLVRVIVPQKYICQLLLQGDKIPLPFCGREEGLCTAVPCRHQFLPLGSSSTVQTPVYVGSYQSY